MAYRNYIACCLSTLSILLFASCGRDQELPLRIIHQSAVRSLDPQTTDDFVSLSVLSNVYETLVRMDRNMNLEPSLAVSWSNPDDNTWRFQLRKGVHFHNGKEFSAEDVQHTIHRGLNHPLSFVKADLPGVIEARVVDSHTVEIATEFPDPLLLAKTTRVFILPKGSEDSIMKKPNGTGPYRLVSSNESVVRLERNREYWRGQPIWEKVEIKWDSDPAKRLKMVEEGKCDVAETPPISAVSKKARIVKYPILGILLLGFSVVPARENPFADARVREAITLAIDQRELIQEALSGSGILITQLAPPEIFGFVPDFPPLSYDPERAVTILRESTYPQGFQAPLYFSSLLKPVALHLAEKMRPLGIEFLLQEVDPAGLDRLLFAQKAPAYLIHYTFPTVDTSDLFRLAMHTPTPDRKYGVLNFSGYSNPVLDGIIERSSTEMNVDKRFELLKQAMKIVMDSHVWIPLCGRSKSFALSSRVEWEGNALGKIVMEEIKRKEGL